ILEQGTRCQSLAEVLALEKRWPLQQFYLIPHLWEYFAQQRQVLPGSNRTPRQRWRALLFRWYWLFGLDVGFHLILQALAEVLRSPRGVRFFYQRLFPFITLNDFPVIDWSDRMLVMKHELFKHFEIELFVPARHLLRATAFIRQILSVFAGIADSVT